MARTDSLLSGRLARRIAGAAMIAVAVVTLNQAVETALHQLWLPLLIALGAFLVTESLLATLLATTLLAALNIDLASPYWWVSTAYPGIALVGGALMVSMAWQRFKMRIAQTHEARWRGRTTKDADPNSQDANANQHEASQD